MNRKQASLLIIAGILIVVALFFVLRAVQSTNSSAQRVAPEKGAYAPQILTSTLTGETIDLEALRGQWVILNFWATWCVPCQAEMPELQELYDTDGTNVIGVNQAESQEVVSQWVSDYEINYAIVLDPDEAIYRLYHILGQPTTYVIDPEGIIRQVIFGATTAEELRAYMQIRDKRRSN